MTEGLLRGMSALVTGGARGLGRAIIDAFAAAGARGIAFDLTGPADDLPRGWTLETGDVTKEEDIERACQRAKASFGRLDCLVANAGLVPPWRDSTAIDLAEWDQVFAINVRGVAASIKHAAPLMRPGGGSVIAMASSNALHAHPRQMAYVASKHAVVGITRAAARDLGRFAIRVNALAPGPIGTEALLRRLVEREVEGGPKAETALQRYAETPLARMATEIEVASAAVFLASPLSAGITGQILPIDAGLTP